MFKDLIIRDGHQREVSWDEVCDTLRDLKARGYEFAVGTDSQIFKRRVVFVTCIVAHKYNDGGRFWYVRERLKKKEFPNLQKRLMYETMKSVWAALELEDLSITPEVHLDLGGDERRSKSAKYAPELTSLVVAQGYDCAIKPFSWASDCADRFTKNG